MFFETIDENQLLANDLFQYINISFTKFMITIKTGGRVIRHIVLLSFLMLFSPLFTNAFQTAVKLDSVELEKTLTTLEAMSADNVDKIVSFSDKKIFHYKKIDYKVAVLKVNQATGYILSKYGYFGLSEKYYFEAASLAENLNDKISQAEISNSLGVLRGKTGDFVKAEELFLKALLISEKEGYVKGIVSSYLKLATLRIRQNRIDQAFDFCLKGDSVNKKCGSHFLEFDLINNKAIVFAIRGNLDKALEMFNRGLNVSSSNKDIVSQISSLQNIGLVYKDKGDADTALDYLNKGIEIANKSGFKGEALRVAVNIPTILAEKKQYNLATEKLKWILAEAKKLGLEDLMLEVYHNLVDIAEMEGNYKVAFSYFKEYTNLKDKQVNQQKQRALQEATVTLGLYKANAEISEKNELLFEKDRERNIIFAILLFVAILLTFLVFILFRLRRLNGRLNEKKELLTESNNIKNKLFSIIGHDLRGHQGTTLGILNLIKDRELDAEETELYLSMIIKQSQSALSTLDDLLLWGRAQIKGDKQKQSELEVLEYVQSALDLNSEAIREKELEVRVVGVEGARVLIHRSHFSFVLRNLIANAIKFTPNKGKIMIYQEIYKKSLLKICVSDSGVGLSNDELKNIFSPENVSKRGTNDEAGTGLGLILCKEFVEANGGKIWAEQNTDGGTTVCFTCLKAYKTLKTEE